MVAKHLLNLFPDILMLTLGESCEAVQDWLIEDILWNVHGVFEQSVNVQVMQKQYCVFQPRDSLWFLMVPRRCNAERNVPMGKVMTIVCSGHHRDVRVGTRVLMFRTSIQSQYASSDC